MCNYEDKNWEKIEKELMGLRTGYAFGGYSKYFSYPSKITLEDMLRDKCPLYGSNTKILKDFEYYHGEFSDGKKLWHGVSIDVVDFLILKSKNYFQDFEKQRIAKEKAKTKYFKEHGYPEDWERYAKEYGDEVVKKYYESWINGRQYFVGMPEGLWLQTHWAYKLSSTYSDNFGNWNVYYWNYAYRGYTLWFKNGILTDVSSRDHRIDF